MPKYAAKVDANQKELVTLFRRLGCSVAPTHAAGKGFPDLVVGLVDGEGREVNLLVEVKDGSKPPSQQKLTSDQEIFHGNWKGQITVVNSNQDAFKLIRDTKAGLV